MTTADSGDASAPKGRRFTILPQTKRGWIRFSLLLALPLGSMLVLYNLMIAMPLSSYRDPLPALDATTRETQTRLEADVVALCTTAGGRNQLDMPGLRVAEQFLTTSFAAAGLPPQYHEYECRGTTVRNIEAELLGTVRPAEIIVIGAHYDAYTGTSADDNASGTAAVLELARVFAGTPQPRTIRFLAFVNEEPPFFQQPGAMGSEVYAGRCKERDEKIVAMLSLEMLGYYSTEPNSQQYPWPLKWLYPSTGDFVAFVGSYSNRRLVRQCIRAFREKTQFPSEGAALPSNIPGVEYSDHWAFSYHGYSAAMVTDTAFFRNNNYHTLHDTPDTLDYERMARVVVGLRDVVRDLAHVEP
ncbi:MAG: M28 family peptidase [Planctomycetota bacterium]